MTCKRIKTFSFFINLIFCFVIFADTIRSQNSDPKSLNCPQFPAYVKQFGKGYVEGTQEYKFREKVYNQKVRQLIQASKNPELTYTLSCNAFSDQTKEERDMVKSLKINEAEMELAAKNPVKLQQTSGMPTSLDWRERGVVTSIKSQGNCGACWTFATNAYGQSKMIIQKKANINIDLSEQFLLSCTAQCSCSGGYLQYVFEKAAGGVPLQSDYPYSPYMPTSPFICWTGEKQFFGYLPEKYYKLSDRQLQGLLQRGPVAISVSAANWQNYGGNTFSCQPYSKVNHAVLLVGYTPDVWIIKNQWGQKWGQRGYIKVTKSRIKNCGIGTSAFVMWESMKYLGIYVLLIIVMVNI